MSDLSADMFTSKLQKYQAPGFAALILVAICTNAFAGFVENRAKWSRLTEPQKAGYVMGVLDETITFRLGDDVHNQYIQDLEICAMELDLRAVDLIDIIEAAYEAPENWEYPPTFHLQTGLRRACIRRINEARRSRGQEPLPE